jgi:hypothetical protein
MQFSKVLSACIGISQANLRVLVIVIGCRRFICHPPARRSDGRDGLAAFPFDLIWGSGGHMRMPAGRTCGNHPLRKKHALAQRRCG